MTDQAATALREAERWLGFQARANNSTPFGELTGYDGQVWSGSFIDYVFFKSGLVIPSCVQTGSGLGEFIRQRRVYKNPQPGDIVFFKFATDNSLGMMHVGLVKDTRRWRTDGLIQTIEAQVNSGLPKGDPAQTGVFERVRSGHEVVAFARPQFRPGIWGKLKTGSLGKIKEETVRPGRRNKNIGLVQLALTTTVGLGDVTVDMFDTETQRAYAHWQRVLGYVGNDVTGIPDLRSLQALGERSKLFSVEA